MARGGIPNPSDPLVATADVPSSSTPPSPNHDVDLLLALSLERERRYKVETDLAITKAELARTQEKLEATEKALEEFQSRHWASHMYRAAEEMGPGGALIATVGAPVMAAPLAVATVVKGFQSVGTGIGSLFKGKEKGPERAGGEAGPAPTS